MWGASGRGPAESERQHQQDGESEGGGRLFPSLIKERIRRDVLGVCNAALRIKEEQSAKKQKEHRRKHCGLALVKHLSVRVCAENFLYFYSVALHVGHI